jgi:hypothetical protein
MTYSKLMRHLRRRRGVTGPFVVAALLLAGLVVTPTRQAGADEYLMTPDPAEWCWNQPITADDNAVLKTKSWDSPQFETVNGQLTCRLLVWFEDQAIGSHILPWKIPVRWNQVCASQFPGSRYVFAPGYANNATCAVLAPSTYRNRIVQWDGDQASQSTSWLVAGNLKRYWVPDGGVWNCLRGQGFGGPDRIATSMLNQLPDQTGMGAACGGSILSSNRIMLRNTYIRSADGRYTLWLQGDGNLVLYGPSGAIWANYRNSDMLVMQPDGNLVTYTYNGVATWSSGTHGTGANQLIVQNDGNLVIYAPNRAVWTYRGIINQAPAVDPAQYRNTLVRWDGDNVTTWFVTPDGRRLWIPDGGTFNELKARGFAGPHTLSATVLDKLPDMNGRWVASGAYWGHNRTLRRGMSVRSTDGRYQFAMQLDGNLVLYGPSGRAIWATSWHTSGWSAQEYVVFQADGNLVTYNGSRAIWASGTGGSGAGTFVIQNDGNLVIYRGSGAVWASNTSGRT